MTRAWLLGAVLLFTTLAFAGTEPWALATAQVAVFALGVATYPRWSWAALAPAAMAAIGAAQLAFGLTAYRHATESAVIAWAAYFSILLVAREALAEKTARRKFLRAALYAGFAIAMLSTAQAFTSDGKIYWLFPARSGRPFGPFVNPDHFAAFLELLLPIALFHARGRSWGHAAIPAALYGAVIATGSRAGAILATAEILALPLLWRKPGDTWRAMALPIALAAAATATAGWQTLWSRLGDTESLLHRREIWASTASMIAQRPWIGHGLGTFDVVYPSLATFDTGRIVDHAHSDWLEWAAEAGLPAALLLAGLALASLGRALRRGWALGIHAVLLHSAVDFPMQIPALSLAVFALLGALYSGPPRDL